MQVGNEEEGRKGVSEGGRERVSNDQWMKQTRKDADMYTYNLITFPAVVKW